MIGVWFSSPSSMPLLEEAEEDECVCVHVVEEKGRGGEGRGGREGGEEEGRRREQRERRKRGGRGEEKGRKSGEKGGKTGYSMSWRS